MTKKRSWTLDELEKFKKLIIKKRIKVLDELEEAKKRTNEARNNNSINAIYSSHMADASTDQEEMEKSYYWMDREKKFIQYLDRALDMLDEGTFGVCITCNELINQERLEEVPHTTSCFRCKSQLS